MVSAGWFHLGKNTEPTLDYPTSYSPMVSGMAVVDRTRASGSSSTGVRAASILSSLIRPRIADRLVDTSLQ
jgi:hypothetical protein